MHVLIEITGSPGSGKTLLAQKLKQLLSEHRYEEASTIVCVSKYSNDGLTNHKEFEMTRLAR